MCGTGCAEVTKTFSLLKPCPNMKLVSADGELFEVHGSLFLPLKTGADGCGNCQFSYP